MLTAPATLEEFDRQLPDEDAARRFFIAVRWPKGVQCPRCGSRNLHELEDYDRWQCRDCHHQPSVRAGTSLHRTRMPLLLLLRAYWLTSRPGGASTASVARMLHCRYATLFDLLHKMRATLAERGAWLLDAPPVHLGTAEIPAMKHANGDPEDLPPVLVGLAVEEAPAPPAVVSVRYVTSPDREVTDLELVERAREHVERKTETRVEPERISLHPLRKRAHRVLEQEIHGLRVWLTLVFNGVSRRYLPNYVAQWQYRSCRWHARSNQFLYIVRRAMDEPWRKASEMVLETP